MHQRYPAGVHGREPELLDETSTVSLAVMLAAGTYHASWSPLAPRGNSCWHPRWSSRRRLSLGGRRSPARGSPQGHHSWCDLQQTRSSDRWGRAWCGGREGPSIPGAARRRAHPDGPAQRETSQSFRTAARQL